MTTLTSWTGADGTIIALDGSDGVTVQRDVAGLDAPPVTNTRDQRISDDGSVLVQTRFGERPIMLPLQFDPTLISIGEIARVFQGPGTLLASTGRQLTNIIYDGGLEGVWTIASGAIQGQTFRKANLDLIALDPWWYGPTETDSGTFGAATPWNAALPWNSAIPWNGGSSASLTVLGDVPAKPVIVVTGAATSVSMSVGGVGGWEIAQPILSSNYLTVSADPAWRGPHRGAHGFFASPDDPIDWQLLTEGSQLFDLPTGTPSLVFGVSGSDANTAWFVAWAPRYLTP